MSILPTDRTILCFGDSNTFGCDPRSFCAERYPKDVRWTGLLAQIPGWHILESGVNGREIPHRPAELEAVRLLLEKDPPTDMVVMLGSNDLLQNPAFSAADTSARMAHFLEFIQTEQPLIHLVLTAPPPMTYGTWVTQERLPEESAQLAVYYHTLAQHFGIRFADAGAWGIDLLFDGVHFSPAGHRAFAEGIRSVLCQR